MGSTKQSVIKICVVILVAIALLISAVLLRTKNTSTKMLVKKQLAMDIPALTATPTASPSPTLTPTPVYTGFCLHVPVLTYHHIQPWDIAKEKGQTSLTVDSNIFDQQMGYLVTHGYNTIFAEDLVNSLLSHSQLPAKSIVVSIDDAYADNYSYAFASIKKYGVKASLFVPTGLVGVSSGANSYFTWGQLKEMVGSELVRAYNHSWSHRAMGTGNEDYEINTPQQQLLQNLGVKNTIFAYPYGAGSGLNFIHQLLAKYGITGAYSTIGGTYQCDSFIYSLHRTEIGSIYFPAYGIY